MPEIDVTTAAQRLNEIALKQHGIHRALIDAFCAYLIESGREPMDFEVVTQWISGGIRTFIQPKQNEETEQQKIGRYIGQDPGFWKED